MVESVSGKAVEPYECFQARSEPRSSSVYPLLTPAPSRAERHRGAGASQSRAAPFMSRGNTCRRGGAVSHYPISWSRPAKTPRAPAPAAPNRADLITRAQALRRSARAARDRAHTPTARRSVSLPRPTPRTAAPSQRSRADAQKSHRHAPHLREAALSWWGAHERDTREAGLLDLYIESIY